MLFTHKLRPAYAIVALLLIAGCGSSATSSTSTPASAGAPAAGASSSAPSGASSSAAPGALAADATSAATGDIPDNQVFLVFTNKSAGYSIKYPEGWTQSGSGHDVTFHSKNNVVHLLIGSGAAPNAASVTAQLQALRSSSPTLTFRPPKTVNLGSFTAIKAVYDTESQPNPVTGKRVKLIVNRYAFAAGGHVAVVDLGTPLGVDNVDAYRKMIESFKWL
jgi:hypothetical protein